jgi:hypothetical protein
MEVRSAEVWLVPGVVVERPVSSAGRVHPDQVDPTDSTRRRPFLARLLGEGYT